MSAADNIPNELMDLIIHYLVPPSVQAIHGGLQDPYDYLVSPPKAHLHILSLVSRNWRACTLRHLFQSVHVRLAPEPPKTLNAPETFIRGLSERKNIRSLLELLVARPEICRCIRRLSLEADPECPEEIRRFWRRWETLSSEPMDAEALLDIIDLLPALQELSLTDIVLSSPPRTTRDLGTVRLGRSARLAEDVLKDLTLFSGITNLHIVFAELSVGPCTFAENALQALNVKSLVVYGDLPWPSFNTALLPSACITSLEDVTIGSARSRETVQSMRGFLQTFASQLISVQLDLTAYASGRGFLGESIPLRTDRVIHIFRSFRLRTSRTGFTLDAPTEAYASFWADASTGRLVGWFSPQFLDLDVPRGHIETPQCLS